MCALYGLALDITPEPPVCCERICPPVVEEIEGRLDQALKRWLEIFMAEYRKIPRYLKSKLMGLGHSQSFPVVLFPRFYFVASVLLERFAVLHMMCKYPLWMAMYEETMFSIAYNLS